MLNWNRDLKDIQYPGYDDAKRPYRYKGSKVNASDIGNINYGVMGAALGLCDELLFFAAGFAQQYDYPDKDTGKRLSVFEAFKKAIEKGSPYYGDQEDDGREIKKGINLFRSGALG